MICHRPFRRMLPLLWLTGGLPLVLAACTTQSLEAPTPAVVEQSDQYFDVRTPPKIDILFMIDNSPSMADKQRNLVKNFPVFMEELKKTVGGFPDVHVGVVSSDLGAGSVPLARGCTVVGGDRGILQTKPTCGLDPGAKFIASSNAGMVNNFTGDISQVFTCMATLGDRGCGYEHQLQAVRVALYESITSENAGFLRPNAYLGIILLTDEDDCSAEPSSTLFTDDPTFAGTSPSLRCAQSGHLCDGKSPPIGGFRAPLAQCTSNESGRLVKVADVVKSVRALKERPDQQIIVAAITGWSDDPAATYEYGVPPGERNVDYLPVCRGQGAEGQATAAIRVREFVQAFGANGSIHPICTNDFGPAMKRIGAALSVFVEPLCITRPLEDTNPAPGLQPDCQVVEQVPRLSGGYDEVVLPTCAGANFPCWRLDRNTSCSASGFEMSVERGGAAAVPGTRQSVKCLTCAKPGDQRCRH